MRHRRLFISRLGTDGAERAAHATNDPCNWSVYCVRSARDLPLEPFASGMWRGPARRQVPSQGPGGVRGQGTGREGACPSGVPKTGTELFGRRLTSRASGLRVPEGVGQETGGSRNRSQESLLLLFVLFARVGVLMDIPLLSLMVKEAFLFSYFWGKHYINIYALK